MLPPRPPPGRSMETLTASPASRTVGDDATDHYNDRCAVEELRYAMDGA